MFRKIKVYDYKHIYIPTYVVYIFWMMNICLHVACKYVYMKSLLLLYYFTEFKRFVLDSICSSEMFQNWPYFWNSKNYDVSFHMFQKIWQILKDFAGTFYQAQ